MRTDLPSRVRKAARIDWSLRHPQPSVFVLAKATILSVSASLAVDTLLVCIGTTVFPSTKRYGHFHFSDYATLTIVGVLIACAAWPVVTRICLAPRRVFLQLAVTVTLVLWLPDVYLLIRHQPVRAVAVLMVMHLAVAIVTYNILVRVAAVKHASLRVPGSPTQPRRQFEPAQVPSEEVATERRSPAETKTRHLAATLAALVGVEFVLGIAALVFIPAGRPSGWLPSQGAKIYLAHAILGVPLTLGAVKLLVLVRKSARTYRLSGWIGAVGVAIAGAGGLLSAAHALRLIGIAFMLVGPVIAGFGYLIPMFDASLDRTPLSGGGSPD